MNHTPYIDPIEHAWRHCNPQAPLPSALVQRAAPYGLVFSLYSSQDKLVGVWSWTTRDIQYGLLTVAILPS